MPAFWQAPWNDQEYDAAMKSAKTYVSQGNLFWMNVRQLCSPTVPINSASLKKIQKSFFEKGPEKLTLEIVVGVTSMVTSEPERCLATDFAGGNRPRLDHARG